MRDERFRDDSGYILFGITILLVILAISLVAAVPLWQKAVQREREQELIFRGYQYMQAIERYQRKYPGAYPPNVDVLVEEKFLRKAFKDPMGGEKGEWAVLRQLSPELQMGGQLQQQQLREQAGITDSNRSRAELRTPGGGRAGSRDSNQATTGGNTRGFQSSLGRGASDASMGGIVGVASRSTEKTFYRVPGKEKYKDWLFVWGAQAGGVLAHRCEQRHRFQHQFRRLQDDGGHLLHRRLELTHFEQHDDLGGLVHLVDRIIHRRHQILDVGAIERRDEGPADGGQDLPRNLVGVGLPL